MKFRVRARGHGQQDANAGEMQELRERLATKERCGVHPEEVSDEEEESAKEEKTKGDVDLVRLFKLALGTSSITLLEVLTYDGNLNLEELIDRINTLDKYFNYEEVDEAKKVKFSMMKLRGHASIWWDGVHANKRKKGK